MESTDVCVLGAGPGGSTAALHLAKAGVRCVLLEKAVFPRDKICGDALSGKVMSELRRIDENLPTVLPLRPDALPSRGIHFVAPGGQWLSVPFRANSAIFAQNTASQPVAIGDNSTSEPLPAPGYLMRRLDFDNLLAETVRRTPLVDFREGDAVTEHIRTANGWHVATATGRTLHAKLLVVANGAQSAFTRHVAGIDPEPKHFCAGLRAYYEGVQGLDANGYVELHFLEPFLPGYLWIFPLPNGAANVGVGMRSDAVSRRRVNLKTVMLDLIRTHPSLRERFANARLVGDIRGYGLPLGSRRRTLSGDGYLLVGDAAHLIDPFTGEGISNAMISGRWAAHQAVQSLQSGDFSAAFLRGYDQAVYRRLGNELRISTRLQRMLAYPWLFNLVVRRANRNPALKQLLSAMFDDIDLRASLRNPMFYAKLLFA